MVKRKTSPNNIPNLYELFVSLLHKIFVLAYGILF